jgi:L-ascorbate metabolism protein UlaG (beta-lactamase superfamily)
MRSFVAAPQVHISALKNAKMLGGPFINYDASRARDVQALLEKTIKEQASLLHLAEAVRQLEEMLSGEADGSSLEPLYERVPEVLKGFVELVYDLNNHPSVRFIEGLLYRSRYYQRQSQSVSLSLMEKDDRSFVFSTPRLRGDDFLHLSIPFDDGRLDELFRMKHFPATLSGIKESLEIREEESELFSSFFTEECPPKGDTYAGDGVRVRYFGHACVLIESKDISILCDPLISYGHEGEVARWTYTDLPETIDYVLVTHNHQDHCMFETLLQLRHKIRQLVVPKNSGGSLSDPSMKLILQNIGFRNVTEIDEMETIEIEGGGITGMPFLGEHGDLNIRSKIAYFIKLQGASILCAADSNNIEPRMYDHIHEFTADVDVLFLGMECDGAPLSWVYGSLLPKPLARKLDQTRRLDGSDYEKGMSIVDRLHPRQVYVYAMGQEPWLTYVTSIQYTEESKPIIESNKLVTECRRRDLVSERLFGRKEIFLTGR